MSWMHRHQGARSDAVCQELVAECSAFLDGRLVEVLECRKAPVPPWAWTNLLAHGSMAQLRLASQTEPARRGDEYWEWRQGRSYLAAVMLGSARSFGPLLALHQEVALIPLELMLAAQPGLGPTSTNWVAQVEALLRFHRDTLRAMNLDIDPNTRKEESQ